MSNKIDVVLLQSVKGLGNKDEVISVAIPYAKNVLFAQNKAKIADKQAIAQMQEKKEKVKKEEQLSVDLFSQVAQRGSLGESLKIHKKSTPQGHLYEKVSIKDIQEAINAAAGVKLESSWIVMPQKIESIGETSVSVQYKGKKTNLSITIL